MCLLALALVSGCRAVGAYPERLTLTYSDPVLVPALVAAPFFWIGGFAYVLLGTLVAGGRAVCSNATGAADILDLLERERPNMVNGFAASVAHLAAEPAKAALRAARSRARRTT